MSLIPNIATVRKYINVNYITQNPSIPPMRKAETELRKVIGAPLLAIVRAAVAANETSDLVELCQDYVCNYAYYLALPDMMVQIGETGLKVTTTDANPQPMKWQYQEKRAAIADKAMVALDDLLSYLLENDVAEWEQPEIYDGRSIKTGRDFAQKYPLRNPEAVFLSLLPIVANVEETYIHQAIGKEFFEAIIQTADSISPNIRTAVAAFTIKEAVVRLNCKLSNDGFTVLLNPRDDIKVGLVGASDQQLSAMGRNAEITGHFYLDNLKKHLNKEAAATGPYALYFASPLYVPPIIIKNNPNCQRVGIYGM